MSITYNTKVVLQEQLIVVMEFLYLVAYLLWPVSECTQVHVSKTRHVLRTLQRRRCRVRLPLHPSERLCILGLQGTVQIILLLGRITVLCT